MPSTILGIDVKFSICLPEDYYTSDRSYPVVYLLHGLGDNETTWLEYGRIKQASDNEVNSGETGPMIFVMPQGFKTYYVNDYIGSFPYQDMFIKELIPFIDDHYRTIPDAAHRATLGYSMGGFGALILPLEHPDIFTICVPLSISIRTEAQYMAEEAPGWDEQWGRLFGGQGLIGEKRITGYYRQHSPFHIISDSMSQKYNGLRIYIANGDNENTLCRSNEELHILLRDRGIDHEYRVLDGGHEFAFWNEELIDGLHFIDDAFGGRKYRGDHKVQNLNIKDQDVSLKTISESGISCTISFPDEFALTDRRYPVIFYLGSFSADEKENIVETVNSLTLDGKIPPVISVFAGENDSPVTQIYPLLEEKYRARNGYRFRAIIGYGEKGGEAMNYTLDSLQFTACSLLDTKTDVKYLDSAVKEKNHEVIEHTWFYIAVPDRSRFYRENGFAHIILREQDIYHEYRVTEGEDGFEWFLTVLPEALEFTQKKIHR